MKVVILAGGFGTRISEESQYRPKPMVEIGGMPILWHIMKEYSAYGINDFIICAGYKQEIIKEWFNNYFLYTSDVTFDFTQGHHVVMHEQHAEPWRVTVVDTGEGTLTGSRIKRVQRYVGDETFCMTYGDGVCDVDIRKVVDFHRRHGKIATLTAVLQKQSKGVLNIGGDFAVKSFREKSQLDSAPINAGYMVLEPAIFDYLTEDGCIFEQEPMRRLAAEGQLMSYQHRGFWQCMDTLFEKKELERLWESGKAPWKVWED
ncbi:MAG: glucose-1-phosphate cytidylyltransferase [Selenomonas bovis]|nr:glucose-1-phosphate cytidylyltransferase [Selenomonas bovis]